MTDPNLAQPLGQDIWIEFDSAPVAGEKVLVNVPADFRPTQPFVITLFLHGHDVPGCSQLHQIQQVPSQVAAARGNSVLLVPRFGPKSEPRSFDKPGALASFIAEAARKVADVLTRAGKTEQEAAAARGYLATQAPIVIASFSGGCHTLGFLLDNEAALAPRLCGVLLLDSLYDDAPERQITSWIKRAHERAWFISLHLTTTRRNKTVMAALQAAAIAFETDDGWSEDGQRLSPGTIAFMRVEGEHCQVPTEGPPDRPVKAVLDRLEAQYDKVPSPVRPNV